VYAAALLAGAYIQLTGTESIIQRKQGRKRMTVAGIGIVKN
jgi:hypothetical protein